MEITVKAFAFFISMIGALSLSSCFQRGNGDPQAVSGLDTNAARHAANTGAVGLTAGKGTTEAGSTETGATDTTPSTDALKAGQPQSPPANTTTSGSTRSDASGTTADTRGYKGTDNRKGVIPEQMTDQKPPENSIAAIDLEKYSYSKRNAFKADMDQKLQNMGQEITRIKSAVNQDPTTSTYRQSVQQLEDKRRSMETRLQQANQVPQAGWEGYKIEFRDAAADLERSVEQMQTALK